jgi:hypothetical protein
LETKNKNRNNIIPFGRNSQFYFNRAMQEYEKGNLLRVKELIELAIEYNKDDIWNYYNLALTLEELEDYRSAIRVWQDHIIGNEELMSEAYFHLALCYSEIDELTEFRKYLDLYLEVEDDQDMKEIALQLMESLEQEDMTEILSKTESRQDIMKSLESKISIFLFNEDYQKALDECFNMMDKEGRLVPLLNRAALIALLADMPAIAYDLIEEVLEVDQDNVGAISNLALYHYYHQDEINVQKVVENMEGFEFYVLGDLLKWTKTLGQMEKHNRAYSILQQVYWDGELSIELCYQLGVAAIKLGKYNKAKSYWQQASLLAGVYSPAELYYQIIIQVNDIAVLNSFVSYNYEWPLIEIIENYNTCKVGQLDQTLIYIAMKYYIRYGNTRTFDFFENLIEALKEDYKNDLIQEVLISSHDKIKYEYLKRYNPELKGVRKYSYKGSIYYLNSCLLDNVKGNCLRVLRGIKKSLAKYQDNTIIKLAEKLWCAYCNMGLENVRRINKEEVWLAAIEHIAISISGYDINEEMLANRYDVQEKSLVRAIEDIRGVIVR